MNFRKVEFRLLWKNYRKKRVIVKIIEIFIKKNKNYNNDDDDLA